MSNCFNCGGRRKVPVVDKLTGDVRDLPCPQCFSADPTGMRPSATEAEACADDAVAEPEERARYAATTVRVFPGGSVVPCSSIVPPEGEGWQLKTTVILDGAWLIHTWERA